jgi:Asp-tRNA(Asn)/Glu-tRNA(Gln) amidotransferase A subunit family amidase
VSTLPDELTTKSATELAFLIQSRAVSPIEVVEAHLLRIEQLNPALNAIVTLTSNSLDQARAAEAELMSGKQVGLLHGVPITVKDTIDVAGLRTTSGSRLRANCIPNSDATAVARLKSAGAIILGKTNTPEMAIPYETNNPIFGRTNNPHDLNRTSGGSSGGEAAAIAACLSPAGIGSDLSGSIRVPAHFCGIVGLKPTTGRVPMDGHTPPATGLLSLGACVGPMARTVADLDLLFKVIADSPPSGVNDLERSLEDRMAGLRGVRVAWYADDGTTPVTSETRAAVANAAKALNDAGLVVEEGLPPGISRGSALWIELFARAATEQLRESYRGREDEAGPQVSHLLGNFEAGTDLQSRIAAAEKVAAAVLERERLREELLRWMKATPLILAPVGATHAFEHGAQRVAIDGQSISVFRAFGYSQTFNVFGLPGVVVPAGRSLEGMPIGVQIVGGPFEEQIVLAASAAIEEARGGWQEPLMGATFGSS